jgi:hypothetical protein
VSDHHNSLVTRKVCGRCGVYRHLHPVKWCNGFRASWWFDRHYAHRHLIGAIWLALPEKRRWDYVGWLHKRRPNLCWCDLVDAAYLDAKADDYRKPNGCLCDMSLPSDAKPPRPSGCYCKPGVSAA